MTRKMFFNIISLGYFNHNSARKSADILMLAASVWARNPSVEGSSHTHSLLCLFLERLRKRCHPHSYSLWLWPPCTSVCGGICISACLLCVVMDGFNACSIHLKYYLNLQLFVKPSHLYGTGWYLLKYREVGRKGQVLGADHHGRMMCLVISSTIRS